MSALWMEVETDRSTFIAANLRILNVCLRHSLLIETASASPSSKDPIQTSFKRKDIQWFSSVHSVFKVPTL